MKTKGEIIKSLIELKMCTSFTHGKMYEFCLSSADVQHITGLTQIEINLLRNLHELSIAIKDLDIKNNDQTLRLIKEIEDRYYKDNLGDFIIKDRDISQVSIINSTSKDEN